MRARRRYARRADARALSRPATVRGPASCRTLRARGALRFSAPEPCRQARSRSHDFADPLVPTEWWRAAVGVDTLTPPPPGPRRHDRRLRHRRHPSGVPRPAEHGDAEHAGARRDRRRARHGRRLARRRARERRRPRRHLSRGASCARGTRPREPARELDTREIVQGHPGRRERRPGRRQPQPRLDEKELAIEQAIYEAVAQGHARRRRRRATTATAGNPLGYPASIPHVLTVGATDRSNAVAGFSSRSRFVDLAAPGVGIPIATARGKGWRDGDGTSFAAPLVSGASAWVWTVRPELDATQLFEVMRRSAVDIGAPGRDDAAGFGLLNVPAALAYPAPVARSRSSRTTTSSSSAPAGSTTTSIPPLTTPSRRSATVQARVDRVEDPRDVYRVWLPRERRVTATADGRREPRPQPLEAGDREHHRAHRRHRPARAGDRAGNSRSD